MGKKKRLEGGVWKRETAERGRADGGVIRAGGMFSGTWILRCGKKGTGSEWSREKLGRMEGDGPHVELFCSYAHLPGNYQHCVCMYLPTYAMGASVLQSEDQVQRAEDRRPCRESCLPAPVLEGNGARGSRPVAAGAWDRTTPALGTAPARHMRCYPGL